MDNSKSYNDLEQEHFEEQVYHYLKTKAAEDPESLTETEGGLLLIFNINKNIKLQKRKEKYLEHYHQVYERAKALVDSYEAGTYEGEDITLDFFNIMPSETDQYVRILGDIDLLVQINEVVHRFMELEEERNPLPEFTEIKLSPRQQEAVEEERKKLAEAGYPAEKIEYEARRRGTFKLAFGEDSLPPIEKPE